MKYLVMECHTGYAVLLDEEGRFCRAANPGYEVGQTVEDPVLMREEKKKTRHAARRISGLVAAAACFLIFFGFGYYYPNYVETYSSVFLTINPEIQMDLNRRGTVVELTGTNEDGEVLLDGYDGRGKDKVTVADELIDRAIDMGFLSEGGQVSFSIDAPDEFLFQEYGTELRSGVEEYLNGRLFVIIEITDRHHSGAEQNADAASTAVSGQNDSGYGISGTGDSEYGISENGDSGYGDSQYGSTFYSSSASGSSAGRSSGVPAAAAGTGGNASGTEGNSSAGSNSSGAANGVSAPPENTSGTSSGNGGSSAGISPSTGGADGDSDYADSDYGSEEDGVSDYEEDNVAEDGPDGDD